MNYWKILSIIFIVVVIGLSINLYVQNQKYNLGGLEIKKTQLNGISDVVGNDYVICDMESNKCSIVRGIG